MTKRDKIVLLSSVLLAICVIASAVLLLVSSNKTNGVYMESLLFVGVTILIGISSVMVVYFSKVRKSKFEKMLNDEYFQEYEIIKDAVMNSQLSNNSKKEIKEDILDILLSSQKAGKPVNNVVENPVTFSREIIRSFTKPSRSAILNLFDGIIGFVLLVIGVNILLWLEQIDRSFFGIGIGITIIVLFALIAFVLIPLTKKLTSTQNSWMFMLPLAFGIAFVLLAEILRKYFYSVDSVKTFLDGTIIMIPNVTVFMTYLLSIPLLIRIKTQFRKRSIKG